MARSNRYNRNLSKVQDMLDGNFTGKIQVGAIVEDIHANRKIGERYFDHDDKEWEKTEWGRKSVDKLPSRGLYDDYCSVCEKGIVKPWDKEIFKFNDRCYHCQIDFEAELKTGKPLRWFAYRRLKDLQNMEAIHRDMEQWVEEMTKEKNKNPFDETVANALANGEVEMTINKNLQ